jgi:hypothetical protein
MTWARGDYPDFTDTLNQSYTFIGNEVDSLVVPVGLAFARVREEHPDIDLVISDKSHPTVAGTYLAACVFYAALYRRSPEGLEFPRSISLDSSKAASLQKGAWDTVRAYYGQGDR